MHVGVDIARNQEATMTIDGVNSSSVAVTAAVTIAGLDIEDSGVCEVDISEV
jgi:hypothetical protein